MRDNILFACAALHQELTNKAISLIDRKVTCFWDAEPINFLLTLLFNIKKKYDWVVKFDEDAFIFDLPRLYKLIDYMESENFDVSGVSDGGVLHIRTNNPIAMSPSFNIFNIKKIREISETEFDTRPTCDDLKKHLPTHLLKYEYKFNNSEIYYPIFFGLLRAGCKFLYLDGIRNENDWTSTYLFDHQHEPFMIHTWFARRYVDGKGQGYYPKHTYESANPKYNSYRINDVFENHRNINSARQYFKKHTI